MATSLTDGARLPELPIWQGILIAFIVLVVFELVLYMALYRRARPDEALVRSGMGNFRVTVGHGMLIWPLVQTVKRVSLAEQTLTWAFSGDESLRWQDGERFEGHLVVTVQVPPENPGLILLAARNIASTDDPAALVRLLEGVVRSTVRDTLRGVRRVAFDIEPAAAEVRVMRALDIACSTFGLRVRSVHLHGSALDTGRLRRTLAHLDSFTDETVPAHPVPESKE
ncbi:MAG: SPFH domain-containing protein [Planctomycetota bacterium]